MFPLLSLEHVSLDAELVRRLPRRLAYYHLALPIAQDEDGITVAMAHPDHAPVLSVLQTVLGTPVAPVRADANEIRAALDQVWREENEAGTSGVLFWGAVPTDRASAERCAALISRALGLQTSDDPAPPQAADLLEQAQATRPRLIVAASASPEALIDLLARSPTSLLLLRADLPPPKRILHCLRGITADRQVLDWVIPLAHHFGASVTLLAAAIPTVTDYRRGNPLSNDVADLFTTNHPVRLTEYGQMLSSMNVAGKLRVRQGKPDVVFVDEMEQNRYDLITIATEAYGDFVARVYRTAQTKAAFLVIKP